jgi:hypothetical protein
MTGPDPDHTRPDGNHPGGPDPDRGGYRRLPGRIALAQMTAVQAAVPGGLLWLAQGVDSGGGDGDDGD